MKAGRTFDWLVQSERRKRILVGLNQPLTATQLARRLDLPLDACLHHLWALSLRGVIYCVNPDTRHNRLYWLTRVGESHQARLRRACSLKPAEHFFPEIPWDLYSSICYSHRSAVIRALRGQMQAAAVRRQACLRDRGLCMSANNTRDVMRYLAKHSIVEKLWPRKRGHPRYELTELGKTYQTLLIGARNCSREASRVR